FPKLGCICANALPVVSDHVNGHCTSPTSQPCVSGRPRAPGAPEGPRLTRRGPGRPPFRKAQSAACMEVSLPVSSLTEGVCLVSITLYYPPPFLIAPSPFSFYPLFFRMLTTHQGIGARNRVGA
ncbi:syntaxin-binding protein 5-like isoform X6, partial [Tachysurus ichikawai]